LFSQSKWENVQLSLSQEKSPAEPRVKCYKKMKNCNIFQVTAILSQEKFCNFRK